MKRPKINEKEAGIGPFLKKTDFNIETKGVLTHLKWDVLFVPDMETFQQMVVAAGAMAMTNPLFLNPLILSQFVNAQQVVANPEGPKINLTQVNQMTSLLINVTRRKSPNVYKSCTKMISLEK